MLHTLTYIYIYIHIFIYLYMLYILNNLNTIYVYIHVILLGYRLKEQNEQLKNAETKLLEVRKTLKQVQVIVI